MSHNEHLYFNPCFTLNSAYSQTPLNMRAVHLFTTFISL